METIGFILLGLLGGALAATLGIGGGVIFVPAFVALFALDQQTAQGTSLAIIVVTTVIATIGHARERRIIVALAVPLAAAGVLGAIAGARVALSVDEETLQRVFAVMLIVVAARMGLRTITLFRKRSVDT